MIIPKISIIVPVYNAEKTLNKCVDSIISQSYEDWELLLINDGSTDNSSAICDEYAQLDKRIRVFHKSNGGVSSARNLGLKKSVGRWITFIDSDDWIYSFYLKMLLSHIKNDIELIISGCKLLSQKDSLILKNEEDYYFLFSEDISCYTVPWGKLYRADIISDNKLLFIEDMKLGEDAVFLYTYMLHSHHICLLKEGGYYYNTETVHSLSKRIFPFQNEYLGYKHIFSIINKFVRTKQIQNEFINMKLNQLKSFFIGRVLNSLYYNKMPKKERYSVLKNIEIELYVENVKPNTWKEFIYYYLLLKKYYGLYDSIRYIKMYLKNKL